MIQHEVGLHHLAIEVKKVFDKTLIERGARGMPGVDHRWSGTLDLTIPRILLCSQCYLWAG